MDLSIPGLTLLQDGTLDRSAINTFIQASDSHQSSKGVATKDVIVNEELGIWVRIYLPNNASKATKLPVFLYFHAGGFIILSAGSKLNHDFCCSVSSNLHVIVVSLEYRLAPEHRLPAAFEDARTCFMWLQSQARSTSSPPGEPWLVHHADFRNCLLMGHSAGATIVHHLTANLPSLVDDGVVNVKGVVSCIPGFVGSRLTPSEVKFATRDPFLTTGCVRAMYTLALPKDATLDHPFGDPRGLDVSSFPPVLLVLGEEDLIIDRQLQFAEFLEESGVKVTKAVHKGLTHSEVVGFPEIEGEAESCYSVMRDFMNRLL